MDYITEVDGHRFHSFLRRLRMGWRNKVIFNLPRFMVGTHVLFWQIYTLIYRAEAAIEHKVWTRRQNEYRENRYRLRQEYFDRVPIERRALAKREADVIMANR